MLYKAMAYEKTIFRKENDNFEIISNLKNCANIVIEELKQIQKNFLSDNKKVQIKQSTLHNDYKDDSLKSVDIEH